MAVEKVVSVEDDGRGAGDVEEATDWMKISYRHAKQLKVVVVCYGLGELIYSKTLRRRSNAIALEFRHKIMVLSRTEYSSFDNTHFAQKLSIVEGIGFSRQTVSNIHRSAAIPLCCEDVLPGIDPVPAGTVMKRHESR